MRARDADVIRRVAEATDGIQKRETFRKRGGLVKDISRWLRDRNDVALYGGMAAQVLMPPGRGPYAEDEVPDFDMLTSDPRASMELAKVLRRAGWKGVERKPALNPGTHTLFAEGISIADFTVVDNEKFEAVTARRVVARGAVPTVPLDLVFAGMFRILSRPFEASFRWEKTWDRLRALDAAFPPMRHVRMPRATAAEERLFNELCEISRESKDVLIGGTPSLTHALTGRPRAGGGVYFLLSSRESEIRSAAARLGLPSATENAYLLEGPCLLFVRAVPPGVCVSYVSSSPDGFALASAMTALDELYSARAWGQDGQAVDVVTGAMVPTPAMAAMTSLDSLRHATLRRAPAGRLLTSSCVGRHKGPATRRVEGLAKVNPA